MSLEYARVGNIEDITSSRVIAYLVICSSRLNHELFAGNRGGRSPNQSQLAVICAVSIGILCGVQEIILVLYFRGQIINTEQFNFITRLDNASTPEARDRVIQEDRQLTARVFVFVLNRISKEQTLQYILTLLDDILQEDKMRVEIFQDYFKDSKDALWSQFFTFFQRGDAFCTYQASRIIAKFACWSSQLMEEKELMHYLNWLRDQLKIPLQNNLSTFLKCDTMGFSAGHL
ncbi:V-type H+-transporting ATPase subunit H [Paragonimus westermani]|uniref:V-type H+-transporting ATPase subunit H n=1 Tax=Paragonimus westermani TaxID=34504 RepID=A0A5J4NR05_9TREM|nr:V-type H+-transporting ATPase subunit H [Paragonimus westermani]